MDLGLVVGHAIRRFLARMFLKQGSEGYTVVHGEDEGDGELDPEQREAPKTSPMPVAAPRPKLSITSPEIWTRDVMVTIISFALLPLHNSAFMQIFPVFLSTPPAETHPSSAFAFSGGLGMASPTIGLYLSAFGIFGILIQLCIYPSLQAWLGTLRSYRVALAIFPIAYLLAPYICLIPHSSPWLQSMSIAVILFLQVTARTFGIPSTVILLTNSAPTPLALGAVHGVGNMLSSLSRTVGPAIGGVIFGWGLDSGVVGTVWWGYLMLISIAGFAWSWKLNEGERPTERSGNGAAERVVASPPLLRSEKDDENEKGLANNEK
jgi:hypothetical protein